MWAIGIIVLLSILMAAMMKVAFVGEKHVTDTYLTQRAQLFMQSALENAIMAIEGYERNGDCLQNIVFRDEDDRFEANVTVLRYYCYENCPCSNARTIKTSKSNGYVLLKVVVAATDNPKNDKKRIVLEKVTLQRP